MVIYIIIGLVSGVLFGVMDGLINSNPFARKVNEVYKPIARAALNLPAGVVIDLVYGFALAGIFIILFDSLPGETGLVKGIIFALLAWFLRVIMSAASSWMMFKIPAKTILYGLFTGMVEMLVLGVLYGMTLKPWA